MDCATRHSDTTLIVFCLLLSSGITGFHLMDVLTCIARFTRACADITAVAFVACVAAICCTIHQYLSAGKRKEIKANVVGSSRLKAPEKPDLNEHDLSEISPIDYDWRRKSQIPYRPWHNGPYHVTMGLKNVTLQDWIELDNTYEHKAHLKRSLFQNHREEVLQLLPDTNDAAHEALHILKDVLIRRYPEVFTLRSPDIIENLVTGDVWDLHRNASTWTTHHPLEVMGLLATEDFFLLQTDPENGVTTLKAASSCFPSGFKIEERVGCSLWQIHAGKVPHYESKLSKSMDRFFQRLRVDSPVQRYNYAIDDSDVLFHRHSHHNVTATEHPVTLEDLHLRVERQVLQRLPKTRALLFSIRVYVTPILDVTADAEVAQALRTNINSWSEEVARYKNKVLWNAILQKHLDERLGSQV